MSGNVTPTVGRIVQYNNYGVHEAAIVTRVDTYSTDHRVDLTVFAPGEPPRCELHVGYHMGPDYPGRTWHWPERQEAQR